jgi:AcrR family transcriptional regulator
VSKAKQFVRIKRKRAYHHGDLRQSVVNAALKLVSRRGPAGFTLAEAAKLAGVVPSALYRHFADRETLLSAVAQEGFETLLVRLESALAESKGDPRKSLVAFGVEYFRFAMDYPAHFQVMFGSEIDKRRFPELLASACRALDILKQITSRIETRGTDLATITWAMAHGLSVLTSDKSFSRTDLSDQPEDLLKRFLPALLGSWG